jgi:hypothetical protein
MSVSEISERKIVTPDVYGSTPFQHEVTAQPTNAVAIAGRFIRAAGSWQRTLSTGMRIPTLPQWMSRSKSSK